MTLFLAILVVAAVISLVGGIDLLLAAFRTHLFWGLACLFLPVAQWVFVAMHWQEARRGFLIQLCAVPFLLMAFVSIPKEVQARYAKSLQGHEEADFKRLPKSKPVVSGTSKPPTPTPAPTPTLEERLAANQREFDRLNQWYDVLSSRRRDLTRLDQEGIRQFNTEVAQYQAALQKARGDQAALARLKK